MTERPLTLGFGTPTYKAACAWDHLKQCGSTRISGNDPLKAGYALLKKQGKITIADGVARLAGEALRQFRAGEDVTG